MLNFVLFSVVLRSWYCLGYNEISRYFWGYAVICRYFWGLKSGLGPSPCSMEKSEYPRWGFSNYTVRLYVSSVVSSKVII